MKFIKTIGLFLLIISIVGCSQVKDKNIEVTKSWVFEGTVALNGQVYAAGDEVVTEIEEQIGTIKHFSLNESESTNDSFSNKFPVGTKLFKISDVAIENAIAVEVSEGHYVKAENAKIILSKIKSRE